MNELVVIGFNFDFDLVFVFNSALYKASQSGFNNVLHGHVQGEFYVFGGHGSLFAVVEVNILAQIHDDMGIIHEFPVGSQARNEALLTLGTIVEENQGLVGVLQDYVVSCVLLFLQVQVVDVSISTDNQLFLVSNSAASSLVSLLFTAATASNCHSNDHQSRHEKN